MKLNVLVVVLITSSVIGKSIYDIEVTEIDDTYNDKGFFETITALLGDTTSQCKGCSGFNRTDFMMFVPELKAKLYNAGDKITYIKHVNTWFTNY